VARPGAALNPPPPPRPRRAPPPPPPPPHPQFLIGLSSFTSASKEDKIKFAFSVFDEHGDGVITRAELSFILKANHLATSEREIAKKAETILTQVDTEGAGVVNWEEFQLVTKRFPNILWPAHFAAASARDVQSPNGGAGQGGAASKRFTGGGTSGTATTQ